MILNWKNIKTGDTVYGSFTLENSGDLFSFLNWEITDYPSWGEWTFNPFRKSWKFWKVNESSAPRRKIDQLTKSHRKKRGMIPSDP